MIRGTRRDIRTPGLAGLLLGLCHEQLLRTERDGHHLEIRMPSPSDTTPRLLTAAGAVVREFVPPDRMEQLLTALEKAFAAVPISGFAAVVNVPTRLAFVAVWSWALGAGQLGPTATR